MKLETKYVSDRGREDIERFVDPETGKVFRRILGGVGWPYAEKPGFIVVLGEDLEEDHNLPHSPRHCRVLAEHETPDLEELQRYCHKFRDDFCLTSILGNPENPIYELWRRRTPNATINVSQPCDVDKIDLNLVGQLLRRNTEGRKTLHFGSDSKLPGYFTRFVAKRIEKEEIEEYPAIAAFGFVLVEVELTGYSDTPPFRPNRRGRRF